MSMSIPSFEVSTRGKMLFLHIDIGNFMDILADSDLMDGSIQSSLRWASDNAKEGSSEDNAIKRLDNYKYALATLLVVCDEITRNKRISRPLSWD